MADLAQVAEAICRGAHPTRWEYRVSSSTCPRCEAGAESVAAAGLVATETEWGVQSPDDPDEVILAANEEEARRFAIPGPLDPRRWRAVARNVTPWRAADPAPTTAQEGN